jgi:hypothetical protein
MKPKTGQAQGSPFSSSQQTQTLNPGSVMKNTSNEEAASINRRSFFSRATLMGGAVLLPQFAMPQIAEASEDDDKVSLSGDDKKIIIAAEIAEALAVATYTNIINTSPFFSALPDDDQAYLVAALQEEMSHYALLESVTKKPSPFTAFLSRQYV